MFDHLGRVLCTECMGQMRTVTVNLREAVFLCQSPECRHLTTFRMQSESKPALVPMAAAV